MSLIEYLLDFVRGSHLSDSCNQLLNITEEGVELLVPLVTCLCFREKLPMMFAGHAPTREQQPCKSLHIIFAHRIETRMQRSKEANNESCLKNKFLVTDTICGAH